MEAGGGADPSPPDAPYRPEPLLPLPCGTARDGWPALPPAAELPVMVEAPGGAWPFSCTPLYDYDAAFLAEWVGIARDPEQARHFIAARIVDQSAAVA